MRDSNKEGRIKKVEGEKEGKEKVGDEGNEKKKTLLKEREE